MAIGRIMAGYDLGGSDMRIRKTLGKKLKKKIPEIRNEFIYGKKSEYDEDHNVIGVKDEPSEYCVGSLARGYSEELSSKIFESMEAFAKYAFNRSHSFCYAVVGYKTAWLSCHYPAEFAVANCTVNENQENITATLSLAKKRKIAVLPPDINHSGVGFTLENGCVRYGLKAIKGVGASVINFIDEYRKQDTVPFKDFDDYYARIHDAGNPVVNALLGALRMQTGKNTPNPMKKDVEVALILSGAFDYCESNRYKLLNHYLIQIKKEKEIKLMGDTNPTLLPLDESEYKRKTKLALEQYYMGSYISEHPLDPFPYADIDSAKDNDVIQTAGIVVSVTSKSTKKKTEYLVVKFKAKDDIERTLNVFDDKLVDSIKQNVKKNQIVIIKGRVSKKYNNISATSVKPVAFQKQSPVATFTASAPVEFASIF